MSEAEASISVTSFTDRISPSRSEVEILHQIVLRAQDDPIATRSPRGALFTALAHVLEEHDLDVVEDQVFVPILLKVVADDTPGIDLRTKFENVLRGYNIALDYDEDQDPDARSGGVPEIDFEEGTEHHSIASPTDQRTADDWNHDEYMNHPPQRIIDAMRDAEKHDRRTLLRQAMLIFKQPRREIATMEAYADARYEWQLRSKVVQQWRCIANDHQNASRTADYLYQSKLRRHFLHVLLDASHQQRIKAMDEQRLRGKSLYLMTIAARESQNVRRIDDKLKLRCFHRLLSKFRSTQSQQAQLERLLQQQQLNSNNRRMRPVLSTILQNSRHLHNMAAQADRQYEVNTRTKFLVRWRDKCDGIKETKLVADDLRTFFLMRKYLKKIQEAAQMRRSRRVVLGKWVLCRWRSFVYNSKHDQYDKNYKTVRKTVKMNLARRELNKWRRESARIRYLEEMANDYQAQKDQQFGHKVIVRWYNKMMNVKSMEERAHQQAEQLALKHSLGSMTEKATQVVQMEEVADRFRNLHNQQVASKALRTIGLKLFEIQRRQEDADAFRTRQDKKLTRSLLDRVRNATAHNRGEEPLRLPPVTPARRRAEELSRLSTTPMYTPAHRVTNFSARLRGEASTGTNYVVKALAEEAEEDDE